MGRYSSVLRLILISHTLWHQLSLNPVRIKVVCVPHFLRLSLLIEHTSVVLVQPFPLPDRTYQIWIHQKMSPKYTDRLITPILLIRRFTHILCRMAARK